MKRAMLVNLTLACCLVCPPCRAHAYLLISATYQGKTGHAAIAVDEYKIRVNEKMVAGKTVYTQDTIATGFVHFFDLWPLDDSYKANYAIDVTPRYYQLPSSKYKQAVSLKNLAEFGLPHKSNYAVDGILTLPEGTAAKDLALLEYLKQATRQSKAFNAMHYNCSDFAAQAVSFYTGKPIEAREWILSKNATTPNMLYKTVGKWPGVAVYKDAANKVKGSLCNERIYPKLLPAFLH